MKVRFFLFFILFYSCSQKYLIKKIEFNVNLSHLGGLTRWEGYVERNGDFYKLKVFHLIKKIRENPIRMETLKVIEKKIPVKEIEFEFDFSKFQKSDKIESCFSGMYDFYPSFYFRILNKEKIEIISKSNCKNFAPWNIKTENGIFIDREGEIYKFVKKILSYSEIPLGGEGLPEKEE